MSRSRARRRRSQPEGGPGEPYGLKTTFYNLDREHRRDRQRLADRLGRTGEPAARSVALGASRIRFRRHAPLIRGNDFGESSEAIEAPYFTNPTACTSQPL